jgi:predicted TPR repeat methyltransferase
MSEGTTQPAGDDKGQGTGEGADYPLFVGPEEYMRLRESAYGFGFLKRWFERRAIARCLRRVGQIGTLCDAPCGPGRLFPCWKRWARTVIGVELSDPMVAAAKQYHAAMKLAGSVRKGDVFTLRSSLDCPADLVASVRFAYYFQRPRRLDVLRALAAASRRWVLVQYKTSQTFKGRRNLARAARKSAAGRAPKFFCTYDEIRAECAEAGLKCLAIERISIGSDRVFVLAERPA